MAIVEEEDDDDGCSHSMRVGRPKAVISDAETDGVECK